jgi:hypothetical protein
MTTMLQTRESMFRCVFASATMTRSGTVFAWDEREAAALWAEELRQEGIEEQGTIAIQGPDGRVARRAAYRA